HRFAPSRNGRTRRHRSARGRRSETSRGASPPSIDAETFALRVDVELAATHRLEAVPPHDLCFAVVPPGCGREVSETRASSSSSSSSGAGGTTAANGVGHVSYRPSASRGSPRIRAGGYLSRDLCPSTFHARRGGA